MYTRCLYFNNTLSEFQFLKVNLLCEPYLLDTFAGADRQTDRSEIESLW